MRVLSLLVWLALVAVLLLPVLRRRPRSEVADRPVTDELVKDPVCQTYVMRSRAVRRLADGEAHYFCSTHCAQRFDR